MFLRLAVIALVGCALAACSRDGDAPPTSRPETPPAAAGHAGHDHGSHDAAPDADAIARYTAPSTQAMADRLATLDRLTDPRLNTYASAKRVEMFQNQVRTTTQAEPYFQLALELLRAGEPERAAEGFSYLLDELAGQGMSERKVEMLHELRALSFLRLGELENCIAGHTVDSCLLPIQDGGVHAQERGSRRAIELYTGMLERHPENLKYRWLLNIAYMTLGAYPDGVPARWRIDPAVFADDETVPRFYDVAIDTDVAVLGMAGGSVTEDFDHDGDLDIMASSWGLQDQVRYMRNEGGRFEDVSLEAGLWGIVGGLNLVPGDYDGDGFVDVLVLRGAWLGAAGRHPNSLLRNRGDGTFADVTEAAGIVSRHPTQTATWADLDLDGDLDLFIGNETNAGDEHPCELYRNDGDGTFTESAAAAGVDFRGFVKGVTSGDYDNDGRPDIYVSCLTGANALFRNLGGTEEAWVAFADVAGSAGVREPLRSFPTWFFDYDNDGWLDLFVAGYGVRDIGDVAADYLGEPTLAERPKLYRNLADGTFADVTAETGLDFVSIPMGANFGDLDNDGWLDFYLGTGDPTVKTILPNRMFRNDGGVRFREVTTSGGFGHLQKGHGISFADLDNDGDQDVHAVIGGAFTGDVAFNVIFANPGWPHRWITIRLEGTAGNRTALGARVRVTVATPDGERDIHRVVGWGGSFGASSLQQEIGLANAVAIRAIEVRWPSDSPPQRIEDVPMDSVIRIIEGRDGFDTVDVESYDLSGLTERTDLLAGRPSS